MIIIILYLFTNLFPKMNCCNNLFRSQSENIATVREARNKNLNLFEKIFQGMNVLLAVLGFSLLMTGSAFISHDLWQNGRFGLDGLKEIIAVFVGIYCILTMAFACWGVMIARNRSCIIPVVTMYGVLLFAGLAVPLMAQGSAILALKRIDNEDIAGYCTEPMEELRKESRIIRAFFEFAHRFDAMSEQMLDKYMCTDTCPCLDYGDDPNSRALYVSAPAILKEHDRTFNKSDTTKLYMRFDKDANVAYESFDTCYAAWEEKAEKNSSIDLEEVFQLDTFKLRQIGGRMTHPPGRRGRGRGRRSKNFSSLYILKHFDEIELYEDLEDEFECSGMCKNSMFYFGRDLADGIPDKTCLV